MCLAVPGKIESIEAEGPLGPSGKVNFGGILKEVCLAYVPEAQVGDYVIVHVGFALSLLDEEEANKTLEYFREMGELAELEESGAAFAPNDDRAGTAPAVDSSNRDSISLPHRSGST